LAFLPTVERIDTDLVCTTTIAATLNTDGVKTRSGGLWYVATVNKILKANAAA
jgi:hypothetical protein